MNSIEIPILLLLFIVIVIIVAVIAGLILLRNAVLSRIFSSPREMGSYPGGPKQKSTLDTLLTQSSSKPIEVNQPTTQGAQPVTQAPTPTATPAPPQTAPVAPTTAVNTTPDQTAQPVKHPTGGIPSGVSEKQV